MPLQPNKNLAHYRIDRKIGEGGMGEVYAATDTRLNRPAAIKCLPAQVAADPERLARFKREAQLLAALNHANIGAIYGLEEDDDGSYLALELIEGDDLTTRMDRGAIPLDEALEIADQVAAALEEAHDKGIIHRDLKPANIKLAADGKVKVLDFGLAKALSDDPAASGSVDLSTSPTLTAAALGTQAGVILGTAGYMSPEQARGKPVDRRCDVWAFGVILFEMLSGERLFPGETVTDVIAQVVTKDPDWETLPAGTPVHVRRVLKRCLQKNPKHRMRDIGDAALQLREGPDELEGVAAATATGTPAGGRLGWPLGLAGLLLGVILTWVILSATGSGGPAGDPLWINLEPPPGTDFARFLELSPDGKSVVFVAPSGPDGEPMLWVRDLADEQARMLPGTEGADQPFWSPDSTSIGFFARRKVRRVSVDGGVSQVLAPAGNNPRGANWGADGTILFVPDWSEPVYRVDESGGDAEVVTTLNKERLELSHRWPLVLPDGKHFLYFSVSTYPEINPENPADVDQSGLYLTSFDSDESRLLLAARSRVVYRDGALIFVDDGILMSRPFDLDRLEFTGNPVTIASGVTQSVGALWGGSLFSVAEDGTVLFVRGAPERKAISQPMWIDREGREIEKVGPPRAINSLALSFDGKRLATAEGEPEDVWIYDFERETSTRFTFDPGTDFAMIWSPDDDELMFVSTRVIPGEPFMPVRVYIKDASGLQSEEQVAAVDLFGPTMFVSDWHPDGKIVAATAAAPGSGTNLMLFSLETQEFTTFLETKDNENSARFSPDGRWVAYESDTSGQFEVYVRAFPGPGGEFQVSTDGGRLPVWRGDGRELFYVDGDERMMSVAVESGTAFRRDTPVAMFDYKGVLAVDGTTSYAVAPDGSRFLVLGPVEDGVEERAVVSLVWRLGE